MGAQELRGRPGAPERLRSPRAPKKHFANSQKLFLLAAGASWSLRGASGGIGRRQTIVRNLKLVFCTCRGFQAAKYINIFFSSRFFFCTGGPRARLRAPKKHYPKLDKLFFFAPARSLLEPPGRLRSPRTPKKHSANPKNCFCSPPGPFGASGALPDLLGAEKMFKALNLFFAPAGASRLRNASK